MMNGGGGEGKGRGQGNEGCFCLSLSFACVLRRQVQRKVGWEDPESDAKDTHKATRPGQPGIRPRADHFCCKFLCHRGHSLSSA